MQLQGIGFIQLLGNDILVKCQGSEINSKNISLFTISIIIRGNYILSRNYIHFRELISSLTLEALRGGGGGQIDPHPLDFFGFKFLLLDRLSKALAQLFLVCEHIFLQ